MTEGFFLSQLAWRARSPILLIKGTVNSWPVHMIFPLWFAKSESEGREAFRLVDIGRPEELPTPLSCHIIQFETTTHIHNYPDTFAHLFKKLISFNLCHRSPILYTRTQFQLCITILLLLWTLDKPHFTLHSTSHIFL